MKKKIIILMLFFLAGCSNKVETEKKDYLTYKEELQTTQEFTKEEDIVCDITTSVDRLNEEEVSYRVIIDNPTVNMYNVKALIIHNYFTEDVFPSIGIFESGQDLLVENNEVKGFSLVGYIETAKEVEDLNLELRIWISYDDESGKTNQIYLNRQIK